MIYALSKNNSLKTISKVREEITKHLRNIENTSSLVLIFYSFTKQNLIDQEYFSLFQNKLMKARLEDERDID